VHPSTDDWKSMAFKTFRFHMVARVLLLSGTIFLFFYLINAGIFYLTIGFVGGLVIWQVIALVRLLENTNRELLEFLTAIRYDDFTQTYSLSGRGKIFDELTGEFNKVIQHFKMIRAEKEAEYQYLKNIIHHLGIGVISFDREGQVQIINSAAKKLFKVNRLKHIQHLKGFSADLVQQFYDLRTGTKALVRVRHGGETIQLAVYAIELYLKGEEFKLVTIQNIHSELEDQEMEAWQNLIRVLTHEIMNSVAPISSLAATVSGEVAHMQGQPEEQVQKSDLEDMYMAIQAIQRRSEALIHFVNDFRNLTHMPEPRLNHVKVKEMFNHMRILLEHECQQHHINLEMHLEPEALIITVDQDMIEQVLINLIKNAIQALQEMNDEENPKKHILLIGRQNHQDRPVLIVQDNGPGIDKDALDRIFIPFFTTKKMGSGIGLSLSRQIMRKHKGTIQVSSTPESGTSFSLIF
jgi:nitrogen fixation/metabolism regulation signal transduction histidine kinase